MNEYMSKHKQGEWKTEKGIFFHQVLSKKYSLIFSTLLLSIPLLKRGAEVFSAWFDIESVSTVPRHVLCPPLIASILYQLPMYQILWWRYKFLDINVAEVHVSALIIYITKGELI